MKIYDASGFDSKLTGSFTGSFYGDGSNLTGIVTYTKAEISGSSTLVSASLAASISNILDGTTPVESASRATTASYALNAGAGSGFPFSGSADITGSLYVSGGNISGSFVGDGSGLTGINIVQSTITSASFTSVTEYTASHAFNTKQLLVNTYFDDDTQFFPQEIKILDNSNVALKFDSSTSGRVVIAKAGHLISGSFIAEEATVVETFTNVTTKAVTHGFGTKNIIVQVYEGDNVINPVSISTTSSNVVTVTFGTPRSGRIVIAKGGHRVTGASLISENTVVDSFTNQSVITTTHNFDSKNILTQVYLDDDTQILPAEIKTIDTNNVRVTLDQARSGRVVIGKAGHVISGSLSVVENSTFVETFTNKSTVTINHGFSTKNILVAAYTSDDEMILPSSVNTISSGSVRVQFDSNYSGRIVVAKGGHLIYTTSSIATNADYTSLVNLPTLVSSSAQINLSQASGTAVSSSFAVTSSFASSISSDVTSSITTKATNLNTSSGSLSFWQGSQTEYDVISSSADPNTIYFVR